jgi:hypothetical protein
MPKGEFEIVVVDDGHHMDFYNLCRCYAERCGLQFQFIRIDKDRSIMPVKTLIPVLTNNVGIRYARGEVLVITGPETLQSEINAQIASTMAQRVQCAYGLVFKADLPSTLKMENEWEKLREKPFSELLDIPGAKAECLTRPPHPPAYAYFIAVARRHALSIGGFDERFLSGLCAEDDDFANRMRMSGVMPVFEHGIVGIHQNHSLADAKDDGHPSRFSAEGRVLWDHNKALMRENLRQGKCVANESHEWGGSYLISIHETF